MKRLGQVSMSVFIVCLFVSVMHLCIMQQVKSLFASPKHFIFTISLFFVFTLPGYTKSFNAEFKEVLQLPLERRKSFEIGPPM